ncbi:MAG: DEAD/DEAH box helicase [Actinomycetaceae bacterium]|nr:DEAD/DEAH box helicase [Actinomycetaceae bacterium]
MLSSLVLSDFVEKVHAQGISLDAFQTEACQALSNNKDVLVCAPTGSGKTMIADFAISLALASHKKCVYTAPIKALSNQKYRNLIEQYNEENVGLLTGDVSIRHDAPILVVTTEVLRNMLLEYEKTPTDIGYVILDEVHFLADKNRGAVWEEIILMLPDNIRFIGLSATISNVEEFTAWIRSLRQDLVVTTSNVRPVPLEEEVLVGRRLFPLYDSSGNISSRLIDATRNLHGSKKVTFKHRNNVLQTLQKRQMLPAIEFIFSRKKCDEAVQTWVQQGVSLTNKDERSFIQERLNKVGSVFSDSEKKVIRFNDIAQGLMMGIGAHHAGMPPILKELTEELMNKGVIKLVYATGTLALGVDMPVRTVVLEELDRWDGNGFTDLTATEYTQLIGRAGRRGKDSHGYAVIIGMPQLSPEYLYHMSTHKAEALLSAFYTSYNTVVSLLHLRAYDAARSIVSKSFGQFQRDNELQEIRQRIDFLNGQIERFRQNNFSCSCGDVEEYLQLFSRAPRPKKSERKKAKEKYIRRIHSSFRKAQHSYVYAYAIEGNLNYGIVLSRSGNKLRMIDVHSQVFWLRLDDLSSEMRPLFPYQLPHGLSLKNNDIRKDIANKLYSLIEERDILGLDRDLELSWDRFAIPATGSYRHHPSHMCKKRAEHIDNGRTLSLMMNARDDELQLQQIHSDKVGQEFDATVRLLEKCDLLVRTSNNKTLCVELKKGAHILRYLHTSNDLLLYFCLSSLPHKSLTAEQLAGWVSQFLDDSRIKDFLPRSAKQRELTLRAQREYERLHRMEEELNLDQIHPIHSGCVDAIERWVQGDSLESVLKISGLSAGDFMHTCRSVADVLGTIARACEHTWLESIAIEARSALRKQEIF